LRRTQRTSGVLARLDPVGALWLGFFASILAAWAGLFAMVAASPLANVPSGLWEALCIGAESADPASLFAMWLLMAAAMMLPTFVPALRTFLNLGVAGAARIVDAVALVAGYVLVWAAGALGGALSQLALARAGFVAPDGSSLSLWLSSALLLMAGAYQLTHLKAACLARCRMPLTFYMERWAPGTPRAFRMGLELGVLCFGCCWALMALAFVGGTMNLIWMGAATLFMVMEKLPDLGRVLTRPAGYLLVMAAGATALAAPFF
jgi:predicted metal-binding membrane protein